MTERPVVIPNAVVLTDDGVERLPVVVPGSTTEIPEPERKDDGR